MGKQKQVVSHNEELEKTAISVLLRLKDDCLSTGDAIRLAHVYHLLCSVLRDGIKQKK